MLIRSVKDVAPSPAGVALAAASKPYRALFEAYLAELRTAKEWAEDWWESLIESEKERGGSRKRAIANVKSNWPVGPVAHKGMIGVIRKFWLGCQALNRKTAESKRVPPEELIMSWLIRQDEALAEFLSEIPFWPMGIDEDGNWV
ncbi:MAG: hypothetical protein LC745_11190 [Planctomycetia bacterium]|nr:hypothetical protein [Planctomycetia bacterium]